MQAINSIMCEYFCNGFINFMLKIKSFFDYNNEYEKNDKMILKYFQQLKRLRWKNFIVLFLISIEVSKTLYHIFSKKTLVLSIIYSKCGNEDEKILKEDESIKIKNSWFDKKYITTLKIWLKKTYVKNLDWKKLFHWRNKAKWISKYEAQSF